MEIFGPSRPWLFMEEIMSRIGLAWVTAILFAVAAGLPLRDVFGAPPSLDDGPIGPALQRSAPEIKGSLDDQLKQIIAAGRRSGSIKGDGSPTPSERAQIAANPLFAQAFAADPAATVNLLRWANRHIRP